MPCLAKGSEREGRKVSKKPEMLWSWPDFAAREGLWKHGSQGPALASVNGRLQFWPHWKWDKVAGVSQKGRARVQVAQKPKALNSPHKPRDGAMQGWKLPETRGPQNALPLVRHTGNAPKVLRCGSRGLQKDMSKGMRNRIVYWMKCLYPCVFGHLIFDFFCVYMLMIMQIFFYYSNIQKTRKRKEKHIAKKKSKKTTRINSHSCSKTFWFLGIYKFDNFYPCFPHANGLQISFFHFLAY
jgi:hypothetical protein